MTLKCLTLEFVQRSLSPITTALQRSIISNIICTRIKSYVHVLNIVYWPKLSSNIVYHTYNHSHYYNSLEINKTKKEIEVP